MNKLAILLFALIIIGSFSCSKNLLSVTKNNIEGTWLLKQYSGGLVGGIYTPTDNSTITFEKSGRYSSSFNYTMSDEGNYNIAADTTGNYYEKTILNLFANSGNHLIYGIQSGNDSLCLSEGCCDRFSYTYIMQK